MIKLATTPKGLNEEEQVLTARQLRRALEASLLLHLADLEQSLLGVLLKQRIHADAKHAIKTFHALLVDGITRLVLHRPRLRKVLELSALSEDLHQPKPFQVVSTAAGNTTVLVELRDETPNLRQAFPFRHNNFAGFDDLMGNLDGTVRFNNLNTGRLGLARRVNHDLRLLLNVGTIALVSGVRSGLRRSAARGGRRRGPLFRS